MGSYLLLQPTLQSSSIHAQYVCGRPQSTDYLIDLARVRLHHNSNQRDEQGDRSVCSKQALLALVKPERMLVVRPKDLPLRFLSGVVVSDLQRTR